MITEVLMEKGWEYRKYADAIEIKNVLMRTDSFVIVNFHFYYWNNICLYRFHWYEPETDLLTAGLNYMNDFPENKSAILEICLEYSLLDETQVDLMNLFA